MNFKSFNQRLLIVTALLFGSPIAYAESAKILILGDSLTAGFGVAPEQAFPTLLQQKLRAKGFDVTIQNGGISGSVSASAPKRLRWHLRTKPDMVMIALGANDGLRGLSVQAMRGHLQDAIRLVKAQNAQVLLAGMRVPPNYGIEYAKQFDASFAKVAKQENVPLVPFLLAGVAAQPEHNLPDGIHPNPQGHEIIATLLLPYFEQQLQKFKK